MKNRYRIKKDIDVDDNATYMPQVRKKDLENG